MHNNKQYLEPATAAGMACAIITVVSALRSVFSVNVLNGDPQILAAPNTCPHNPIWLSGPVEAL